RLLQCLRLSWFYLTLLIRIESFAAGFSNKTRGDQFFKERRRPVAIISRLPLQAFEYRQNFTQPDLVGPTERTLRIIDAELHGEIDFFRGRDAFFQASRGFINY